MIRKCPKLFPKINIGDNTKEILKDNKLQWEMCLSEYITIQIVYQLKYNNAKEFKIDNKIDLKELKQDNGFVCFKDLSEELNKIFPNCIGFYFGIPIYYEKWII